MLLRQDLRINDSVDTNFVEEIAAILSLRTGMVHSILVAEEVPVGDERLLWHPVVVIDPFHLKDSLLPLTQFWELSKNAQSLSTLETSFLYSEIDMISGLRLFIESVLFVLDAQLPEDLILITLQ